MRQSRERHARYDLVALGKLSFILDVEADQTIDCILLLDSDWVVAPCVNKALVKQKLYHGLIEGILLSLEDSETIKLVCKGIITKFVLHDWDKTFPF